ncbi:MAG: hypothetical protein JRI47_08130, partial [Deltaproteobacteria bacterium]|nr:hypothetical protein [Deltaproteobacteria bacterium]
GDGNPVVTVWGFTEPDVMVFEMTDARRPRLIESKTVEPTSAGYGVSIEPASQETLYFAVAAEAVVWEVDAWADTPSMLAVSDNSADYLLITPPELRFGAQRLAEYRMGRGLSTMVVDLEDVMDEFNYGIYSPEAMRDFLSYAYAYWNIPPAYVVLVGDGTFDYKDNQGHGDNLMPPLMVSTPHGLFASDNRFVDVEGEDGVPEMAIGRLPVFTEDELHDVVDKIIAYEYAVGEWTRRVLMLADNPDGGGDFPSDSNDVAVLLHEMGYAPEKIYLSELPIGEARQRLLDGIEGGAGFLNYIGHAGVDRLADEGLLLSSDVSSLANTDRFPIVTAMTCVVGQFAIPGYDSLSERLVITNDAGAVAVWSPTGMSINADARILDEEFFRAAPLGYGTTLGQAVLEALEAYSIRGSNRYMLDIYNVLGDPALEIN